MLNSVFKQLCIFVTSAQASTAVQEKKNSPIDCSVRINHEPESLLIVIFSHRYIDSNSINFKTFVFLIVH